MIAVPRNGSGSVNLSLGQCLPDHDPVPVNRSQSEFPHPPRLVLDHGKHGRALGFEAVVMSFGVSNAELREVAMAAEIARRQVVRTLADQILTLTRATNTHPAGSATTRNPSIST